MIKAAYGRVVVYIYMGSLTLTSINRIISGLGIPIPVNLIHGCNK